jgi:hypothetical protein
MEADLLIGQYCCQKQLAPYAGQKKAPENRGLGREVFRVSVRAPQRTRRCGVFSGLKDRNRGGRHCERRCWHSPSAADRQRPASGREGCWKRKFGLKRYQTSGSHLEERSGLPRLDWDVSRHTRYQTQFTSSHSSMPSVAMQHNRPGEPLAGTKLAKSKGPPETGGPPKYSANAISYSAATLRGGSSAPESWISAT